MLPTTDRLSPGLKRLMERGNRIWSTQDHLRQAFPAEDPASPAKFWFWLMWHGTEDFADDLDGLLPPYPPGELSGRVVGLESSEREFLLGGVVNWQRLRDSLLEGGFDFGNGSRLLDFGVGCGRILRHFAVDLEACELYGCDVDAAAVDWCRKNLDMAEFFAIRHLPPIPKEDGFFDGLFAYSVFSHLPEARHRAWLEELARVTRPGGTLVLTIQGPNVAELTMSGQREHPTPPAEELQKEWDRFESEGFLFFPYREIRSPSTEITEHFADWDLLEYGSTFISETYVRERWSDLFEIVAFHPAPDQWQDYVVLRR